MSTKQNDGSKLSQSEAFILKTFESELDSTLELLRDYEVGKQGYKVHNSHIETINLQKFGLEVIPSSMGKLVFIRNLILEGNRLKMVDFSIFEDCKQLGYINFRDNQISQVELFSLQSLREFEMLVLSNNQIQSIDLFPLKSCSELSSLSLDNNQLKSIDLSFLSPNSPFSSLTLYNNSIKQIDITPLLSLPSFTLLHIDSSVHLTATPLHRDYSLKHKWFLYKHLPGLQWLESSTDPEIRSLFDYYNVIMKNFRHDEFWADFRYRRRSLPSEAKEQVEFFDFAVHSYLKAQEKALTIESQEEKALRRMNIEQRLQGEFLSSSALLPHLKTYFEVSKESTVFTDNFKGDIFIFHYWRDTGPTQLLRVQSFSWIQIHVDMVNQSYHVTNGFNRGWIHHQQKYNPIPAPSEFPPDVFETTEVSYTVRSVTTSYPCDILSQALSWLKFSYAPVFDPDNPTSLYRSPGLDTGF